MQRPVRQGILNVQPVPLPEWGLAAGTAPVIVVVMESYLLLHSGSKK